MHEPTDLKVMAAAYAVFLNTSIEEGWDGDQIHEALSKMIVGLAGDLYKSKPTEWLELMDAIITNFPRAHEFITNAVFGQITPEEDEKLREMAKGMKLEDLASNKIDQELRRMSQERMKDD